MKKLCLLVCMSLGLSATAMAEGDAEAGKAKSAVCAACHGPDGNSMQVCPRWSAVASRWTLHEFAILLLKVLK